MTSNLSTTQEELLYHIALTRAPWVGAITARALLSYCGSARAVFASSARELLRIPGIGKATVAGLRNKSLLQQAEMELRQLEQHPIQALILSDPAYPERLKSMPDAPVVLYYQGTANLNALRTVAIVGTRQPTPYGQAQVLELVQQLKPYAPLVISGLAYGVDVAAHRACLEVGLPTVGVLGHGLGQVYPASHRQVAGRMRELGGLLTEFTYATGPEREHFPMRNRIVAALCDALVVVETARQGGSMITAQCATDYDRQVFAVPGRVNERLSEGCNWLIKTRRAALLEHADDLAYVMRWDQTGPRASQTSLFEELTEDEKNIVALLRQHEQLGIDRLGYEIRLGGSALAAVLLELECKGAVRALPGKRYTLP